MRKIARKPTPGLEFSDLTDELWLNYPLNLSLQFRLFCAVALDDSQHRVLADAQPQSDLAVRLPGSDQFKRTLLMAIGLDALAGLTPKAHAARLRCGNARAHPLAQQIPFEFGQNGHQRRDELSLRRAQIELQACLGFYAQIHEIFRLLKEPMAYAQSIPAKIASKSIGLRLSLKA